MTGLSLLFVGAHPDDEGSLGGCLIRYAEEGARVDVACATRGDGADAQIKNEAATRETLGQVRSQELACACERLGINSPHFLGYQDGEVDRVPPDEAARSVARLIRELRPAVVVTHGPEGGYGHPDHIAVSGFVTRAFDLAADPAFDSGGAPFAPAKLYYTALPRSYLEKIPGFRERRADIRGQQLPFVGVADEQITTQVDIRRWLRAKMEAMACHRSQFEFDPETNLPKTFGATLPEAGRVKYFGHERFVLARPAAAPTPEDDLFAGLR
jgi:LmbE family N-acetylglucosaminyl deacetylase